MSDIAMIAKLTSAEGKLDELVAVMSTMVEAVKAEPGTLVYAMHVSAEQSAIYFYERYTDKAALDAHGTSDAMKAGVASQFHSALNQSEKTNNIPTTMSAIRRYLELEFVGNVQSLSAPQVRKAADDILQNLK